MPQASLELAHGEAEAAARRAQDETVDMAVVAVTAALLLLVGLGVSGPARVLVALAFVSLAPGWAVLDWLSLPAGPGRVAVAVVLSLTICTALAMSQLWLGVWRPQPVFELLATFILLSVGWRLLHRA